MKMRSIYKKLTTEVVALIVIVKVMEINRIATNQTPISKTKSIISFNITILIRT